MLIVCLIFLIALSGLLAGSETSLFSLSPMTLKSYQSSKNPGQQLIASLMKKPRDVLVTLLMLNMFVNILVQNTVANVFATGGWGLKVGIPLLLILIFGEILPKSIALQKKSSFALLVSPFVSICSRILKPLREPLTKITNWISRFLFVFLRKEEPMSFDELRLVLQTSEENGVLLPQECDLIEGALDLHQSTVRECIRPRDEILFFDIQDPLSHLIHLFVDLEISRIPVCDGQLEKIIGILSTREYFINQSKIHTTKDLLPILKKPYFVPETIKAWTLLNDLREKQESLAIVVDEYGSISGLITQEDLIESVVGEIKDRRDPSALYTKSSNDVIIASGKLELSEFKEIFGIALKSSENIVTLGGWLIEQLGDIPIAGTKYEKDPFLFHVLAADPNRIRRIYVRRLKK